MLRLITLVSLAFGVCAPVEAGPGPRIAPATPSRLSAVVERVSDGDTLRVTLGGESSRVRLIGLDTPESSDNERARRQSVKGGRSVSAVLADGQRALRFVTSLVKEGDRVDLELDRERRDRYGRLLAYVYLPDGSMLNERILAEGFAYPYTHPPNLKHAARFQRAFREARERQRGLWAERRGGRS